MPTEAIDDSSPLPCYNVEHQRELARLRRIEEAARLLHDVLMKGTGLDYAGWVQGAIDALGARLSEGAS